MIKQINLKKKYRLYLFLNFQMGPQKQLTHQNKVLNKPIPVQYCVLPLDFVHECESENFLKKLLIHTTMCPVNKNLTLKHSPAYITEILIFFYHKSFDFVRTPLNFFLFRV